MTNVTYKYPYAGYWSEKYKYGLDYSDNSQYFGRIYTYPLEMNNPMPKVSNIKVWFKIGYNSAWLFTSYTWIIYGYNTSKGWFAIKTGVSLSSYTTNTDADEISSWGTYVSETTIEASVPSYDISKIAVVPSSNPGSITWNYAIDVEEATITETVADATLTETNYFCGIRPKTSYYGLYDYPSEVSVNIGGSLVKATAVAVNIGDELVYLPRMHAYNFVAVAKEASVIIPFVPVRTGKHTIDAYSEYNEPASNGYAYFKVFDENMAEITDGLTGSTTIEMEVNKQYYIYVIDTPYYEAIAQRTLKIYNI